ncbi:LptF/LptG family permease [bacterium]|nr:LptF/LptG family permease [bacterium]MBU1676351.1 LptF/LptG family permease [bacterium]
MRLVHRNAVSGFLRILLFTILGALILFTLVDLFDHMDSFMDNKATPGMMARYYLNKIPWIIDTVLPIGMLMATLFSVGMMARYNELTALFAAGRSLMQVTRPLMLLAAIATLFSLAWSEFVLPGANAEVERIWEVEVHGRPDRIRPTNDIALTGTDGWLYYARTFVPEQDRIKEFRAHLLAGARVVERYDAETAVWEGGQWMLQNGTHRWFSAGGDSISRFENLASGLGGITPQAFRDDRLKPESMNVRQLRRYVHTIRSSGGDATAYEVDLHFKLAFPVVHLVVVFLGILLASGPRKTTVASGFGWTILISFGYYLSVNFGRALGHNGALPPVIAAWAGNLAYSALALTLFLRVRR